MTTAEQKRAALRMRCRGLILQDRLDHFKQVLIDVNATNQQAQQKNQAAVTAQRRGLDRMLLDERDRRGEP